MSNTDILRKILKDYPDVLYDRKKLQALFMDFFPEDKLLRNTLLMAYDEGIVSEMLIKKQIDNILFHRYVSHLEHSYGVAITYAETVIELWAYALGVLGVISTTDVDSQKISNKKATENIDDFEFDEVLSDVIILRYKGDDKTEIIIPNTYKGKQIIAIEDKAFQNCETIEKVIVPEGVLYIGCLAFENCSNLREVQLPYTLKGIGKIDSDFSATFKGCSKLEKISIPDGLKHIGSDCFFNCSSLTHIELPNEMEYIGARCFCFCSSLINIKLPDNLTTIEEEVFYGCTNLKGIVFPSNLKHIKESAFGSCKSLEEVDLPYGLISISSESFSFCDNLKSIYIPRTVTEIDENAFMLFSEVTIHCAADSYAMQFIKNHNAKYN